MSMAIAGIATAIVVGTIQEMVAQQRKRDEIDAQRDAEITNLLIAKAIVTDRVYQGFYDRKNVDDVITDLKFIQMTRNFEV